jgi:type II secretory pathway predicted ATPase ExeA
MFGIEAHRGLLVLTGEAGTGKTTLIRHFLQWLKDRHFSSSYIFHTHLDPAELFEFILRDFGVPVDSTKKSDLLATLHRWLHAQQAEGDSPVIVIDEAQALSLRTLSELNLLLNLENARGKLVQIVLAGQPELEEKLRRPESRAVRQRIMVRCRLPLLSLEETEEYIASRLLGAGGTGAQTFPTETVQTIYSYARGVPRIVNLLCEHALVGAYADRQTTVSPQNVRRVAAEFDLEGEPFSRSILDIPFTPKVPVAPAAPVEAPEAMERPAVMETAAVPVKPIRMESPAVAQQVVIPESVPINEPPVMAQVAASIETPPIIETPAPADVTEIIEEKKPVEVYESISEVAALWVEQAPTLPTVSLNVPPVPEVATVPAQIAAKIAEPRALDSSIAPQTVLANQDLRPLRNPGWRKHHVPSPFQLYWREVAESFLRDWRHFFTALSPRAATFPGISLPSTESLRRSVIEPLRNWLAKPMPPGPARTARPSARPARAEKR